jgi:hypothetical protein
MHASDDQREILHDKDITKLQQIKVRLDLGWSLTGDDCKAIVEIAQRCNYDTIQHDIGQPIEWFLQFFHAKQVDETMKEMTAIAEAGMQEFQERASLNGQTVDEVMNEIVAAAEARLREIQELTAFIDQQIAETMNEMIAIAQAGLQENQEDICEKSQPALKFSYWEKGIVALNSDAEEEHVEEVEKPLEKQTPHWPTLDGLVARSKAFEAAHPESSLAKRPPLGRTQTPTSRSSSSSSGREQSHPAERPIPAFLPDLREEVMWALENPITGRESKLAHDCKRMSEREQREDLDRETLIRLHKEFFRGFSSTAPAWTISQKQVAVAKRAEENDKYYAEQPPEWFAAEKAYVNEKEAQKRAKISRARMQKTQANVPEENRVPLTAAQRKAKQRLAERGVTAEEWKLQKAEKKAKKQEERKAKDLAYQQSKRNQLKHGNNAPQEQ